MSTLILIKFVSFFNIMSKRRIIVIINLGYTVCFFVLFFYKSLNLKTDFMFKLNFIRHHCLNWHQINVVL